MPLPLAGVLMVVEREREMYPLTISRHIYRKLTLIPFDILQWYIIILLLHIITVFVSHIFELCFIVTGVRRERGDHDQIGLVSKAQSFARRPISRLALVAGVVMVSVLRRITVLTKT